MQFPRIYEDKPLPPGYDGSVRVLANMTTAERVRWLTSYLSKPGCADCTDGARCEACAASRQAFGESFALIYGPALLGEDVSTAEAALAFLERDDALPDELIAWLFVLPDAIYQQRVETIRKNARSSLGAAAPS